MTSNIQMPAEKAANDLKPEPAKVAPATNPPAVDTEKKPADAPPLKL